MSDSVIHRIGLGTDVHRLGDGGPLRLGGIDIDFDRHLVAHSDGDVAVHALIDALLGAAGESDIGERFPDTDPRYRGADSTALLAEVVADLAAKGWSVAQADLVIQAERPRLSPYKDAMRRRLATLLGAPVERVAVKAKTNEGLDAVGRGEAIAAVALVGLSASGR